MSRRPRSLVALALATLLGCVAASQAQAAAPMVLLRHGGGWQSGDPTSMYTHRDELAADGYRTRVVAYPLGSVSASIDYVDAIAQEERLVGEPVIRRSCPRTATAPARGSRPAGPLPDLLRA